MHRFALVVLFACAGTTRGYTQSSGYADTASKILALETVWNRAAEAKDLRTLDAIVDEGFVYVESDGKLLNKAEFLAEVKGTRGFHLLLESTVVQLHGETAVVTGIYQRSGMEGGKPFVKRERFVNTWCVKSGAWIWIASLFTPTS
jgi:hypothetical protein